jgi:hypothetical protein
VRPKKRSVEIRSQNDDLTVAELDYYREQHLVGLSAERLSPKSSGGSHELHVDSACASMFSEGRCTEYFANARNKIYSCMAHEPSILQHEHHLFQIGEL